MVPSPTPRSRLRTGASAVEFGLLMPVVMAVMYGIFEFGWAFYEHDTLVRAVRAGCRAGAVAASDSLREDVAEDAMADALRNSEFSCSGPSCIMEATLSGPQDNQILACRIATPYQPLTDAIPMMDRLTLTSATRLRVEWLDSD